MSKRRALPVHSNVTVIHKRKPRSNGRGRRSVCGRYGYTTHFWKNANCDVCLNGRPG